MSFYERIDFHFDMQLEEQHPNEVNSRWYDLIADLASRRSAEQDWCHTIYLLVSGGLFHNNSCNAFHIG